MDELRDLTIDEAKEMTCSLAIPELIKALCGTRINGEALPTQRVEVGRGILDQLPQTVAGLLPADGNWAVVMDEHTKAAAGDAVLGLLPHAFAVVLEPLPGWDHVTPHEEMLDLVGEKIATASAVVAVGSGTINDLCKTAVFRQGKEYAVVATAPSMNGYTSALSAIVFNGLKTTAPCPPPIAVMADVDVLITAPPDMARSGYADMMAKPVSSADWKLGSLVVGGDYNELPSMMVSRALDACIACAEDIAANDPAAIETLMRCLILSGFSMAAAGSSAPASGGEHLISHYWDMSSYLDDVPPPALHGYQVALGTLLSARLYELLWQQSPADFEARTLDLDALAGVHGKVWPAIASEARAQNLTLPAAAARVAAIQQKWGEIRRELRPMLRPAAAIRDDLARGGVPTTPTTHGMSRACVRLAFRHAAEIRNRYSVLHFARELGVLDRVADDVLGILDI